LSGEYPLSLLTELLSSRPNGLLIELLTFMFLLYDVFNFKALPDA